MLDETKMAGYVSLICPMGYLLRKVPRNSIHKRWEVAVGKFDQTIEWLDTQMKNASDALEHLNSGNKIERNGEDITEWWKAKYEEIIKQSKQLIAAYKKNER